MDDKPTVDQIIVRAQHEIVAREQAAVERRWSGLWRWLLLAYAPTTLQVMSGQPVEVTFQNTGSVEHDFSITAIDLAGSPTSTGEAQSGHMIGSTGDQPKLHVAATVSGQNTLTFTPTKPGQYQYYCTVAGHKDAGMIGVLTVK